MTGALVVAAMLAGSVSLQTPAPSYKSARIALYVTAAADVITTRIAIRNGATEGNPLLTPFIGKAPSTMKLVAAKAVSIGMTEAAATYLRRKGEHGRARFLYWLSVVAWGGASALNLQFAW